VSTQLLFYERVTPISQQRHGDLCVGGGAQRYEFARRVNSVPLTAIEIPAAARDYTIVFAGDADAVVPVVILGIEGNDNLYLTEDGGWDVRYVPAFVRRYPFVFASSDDGGTFTLCIDESWDGCNREGVGERLFDAEGERTSYLEGVLKFLQDYQNHFRRTQAYCSRLKELSLLEPMQAELTLGGGEKRSLTGFMAVNREKLKGLSGEQLSELAKTDELELTYVHLQSMNNFSNMLERVTQRRSGEAPPDPEPDAGAP